VYGSHSLVPIEYLIPTRRIEGEMDYTPMRVLLAQFADLEQLDSRWTYA
jgi:hypothetical protein